MWCNMSFRVAWYAEAEGSKEGGTLDDTENGDVGDAATRDQLISNYSDLKLKETLASQ